MGSKEAKTAPTKPKGGTHTGLSSSKKKSLKHLPGIPYTSVAALSTPKSSSGPLHVRRHILLEEPQESGKPPTCRLNKEYLWVPIKSYKHPVVKRWKKDKSDKNPAPAGFTF